MRNDLPLIRSLSRRYPKITVALTLLLICSSLLIISRFRFDTDVTRLIPVSAEKTALYFKIMDKFGGMEKSYIIFTSDDISSRLPVIEGIGAEIIASGLATHVEWKISEGMKTYLKEVFAKKYPLLLSDDEMRDFVFRLSEEGMSRELKRTRQRLNLPFGGDTLQKLDPLNLGEILSSHMKLGNSAFDPRTGYYLTGDGKSLVMILSPQGSPRDITFSNRFIETLDRILSPYRIQGMKIDITGSHAITLHEASIMKQELISNASTSFLSVTLIFLIFFRSLKGALFIILPALLGVIVTTAGSLVVAGNLSEVTGAFAGLIAGLGDDLGIVLYVSYLLHLNSSETGNECMDRSITAAYRSITTGMLTTAVIFLPMLLSSFKGVRELGVLTGTGMLLCWFFLFTTTSLLIKPSSGKFIEIKTLSRMASFSYRAPYTVIALTAVITILLSFFIPRVPVIGDITKLGTADNPARNSLEAIMGSHIMNEGLFVTDSSSQDLETALSKSLVIRQQLSPVAEKIFGPSDLLPPLSQQEKNLKILLSMDADKIGRTFLRIAEEEGFEPASMKIFTDSLVFVLGNRQPLVLEDLEPVRDVFDRFAVPDNGRWMIMVTGNLLKGADERVLGGLSHTGPSFIKRELLGILQRDGWVIGILGLVLVNIILFLDFRSLFPLILCQAPVVISIACTLGVMGLTGISLNFMNIIVFVLLFGIGTDYTLHLIHRYNLDHDISATFLQTGKAVLVAALTTIAGFGSIGFSSYRGLASMGQVSAIGVAFCLLFSLCLLPSLLRLTTKESDYE